MNSQLFSKVVIAAGILLLEMIFASQSSTIEAQESERSNRPAKNLVKAESESLTGLTDQQIADGWISLFDGRTLYGWRNETETVWKVDNRTISCESGKVGLLRTTTQFDDYEMLVDFKADASTNSGIFFRTSPNPKNPSDQNGDCFELNIAPPDNPFPVSYTHLTLPTTPYV